MDYISILQAVWAVVEPELAGISGDALAFAKKELAGFAVRCENFAAPFLAGQPFSMEEAKLWLSEEEQHAKAVLLTAEGIGEIAAEKIAANQTSVFLTILMNIPKAVGL